MGGVVPCLESLEERVLLSCDPVPPPPNTAPTIANLDVQAFDNGTSLWGDTYVTGNIVDDTRAETINYSVYVDLDGDQIFDENAIYPKTADSFAYQLRYDNRAGSVTVKIIEHIDGPAETDTASKAFDLDFSHNDPPEILEASIEYYGTGNYGTLHVKFRDYTRAGNYSIEYDGDGDGVFERSANPSWPGSVQISYVQALGTPTVRIVERVNLGGPWIEIAQTSMPVLGAGPGTINTVPEFDPQGDYSRMIFYGDLVNGASVGSATATDADGDSVVYSLSQPSDPQGGGSNGRFYHVAPPLDNARKGVTIGANGAISINNVEVIQAAFRESGKYTFTVWADDGGNLIDKAWTQFTIYDDGSRWIDEAENLVGNWYGAYHAALGETRDAADLAIQQMDAFAGFDHISAIAGPVNLLWITTIPKPPLAQAVAMTATTIIADALASNAEGTHDDVLTTITASILEVTSDSRQEADHIRGLEDSAVDSKRTELYPLTVNPDLEPNTAPPDVKAQEAYALYVRLAERFEYDYKGWVESVERDTIAPSRMEDILGELIVDYDLANDDIIASYNFCAGIWSGVDEYPIRVDGDDIADKLNALGFVPTDIVHLD